MKKYLIYALFMCLLVFAAMREVHTENKYKPSFSPLINSEEYEPIIRGQRISQNETITHYTLSKINDTLNATTLGSPTVANYTRVDAIDGYLLAADKSYLYKSTNHGLTLQYIKTFDSSITAIYIKNSSLALVGTHSGKIYRSTDFTNFVNVLNLSTGSYPEAFSLFGSFEDNIYIGEYDSEDIPLDNLVWKSSDAGLTWSQTFNSTEEIGYLIRHNHIATTDPYNGDVYVSTGDSIDNGTVFASLDGGTTWDQIIGSPWRRFYGLTLTTNWAQPTSVVFTPKYAFFGSDKATKLSIWRYHKDGEFGTIDKVINLENSPEGHGYLLDSTIANNVSYFLMRGQNGYNSAIWASDTNIKSMIKIYDLGDNIDPCYLDIAADNKYLYVACNGFPLSYPAHKFNLLDKTEIKNLLYDPTNETLNQSFSIEQLVMNNETLHYSLYQNPIDNATLTIKPINVQNLVQNPSFESLGATYPYYWDANPTLATSGNWENTTINSHDGSYSIHIKGNNASTYWWRQTTTGNLPITENKSYRISFYYRFNSSETSEKQLTDQRVWFYNSTGFMGSSWVDIEFEKGHEQWYYSNHEKDWRRAITKSFIVPPTATSMRTHFIFLGYNQDFWIDAVQIQEDIGWATPFLETNTNTSPSNIEITVTSDGYTDNFTLPGNLTEDYIFNFSHPVAGHVTISSSIEGSGVVNTTLKGERILNPKNALVEYNSQNNKYNITSIYSNPVIEFYKDAEINLKENIKFNINKGVTAKIGDLSIPNVKDNTSIVIDSWKADYKEWNETNINATSQTEYIIGDFYPNLTTFVSASPSGWNNTYLSNLNGFINFTYNGGYSEQNFIAYQIVPDTTPPEISLPTVFSSGNITYVIWISDENSTSQVNYSLTSGGPYTIQQNSTFEALHVVSITNLMPLTKYYYRVISIDPSGNMATTNESNFTTTNFTSGAYQISIENITSTPADTTSTINWDTNVPTNTTIYYGINSTNYTNNITSPIFAYSHSLTLTNLVQTTIYYYKINSTDIFDNVKQSLDFNFTTTETPTTPPGDSSPTFLKGGTGSPLVMKGSSDDDDEDNETQQNDTTDNDTNTTNSPTTHINLVDENVADKTLSQKIYSLSLVLGVEHTLELNEISLDYIILNIDGNINKINIGETNEIFLDGFTLSMYYYENSAGQAKIQFTKNIFTTEQFLLIPSIILILITSTILITIVYFTKKKGSNSL